MKNCRLPAKRLSGLTRKKWAVKRVMAAMPINGRLAYYISVIASEVSK